MYPIDLLCFIVLFDRIDKSDVVGNISSDITNILGLNSAEDLVGLIEFEYHNCFV